MRVTISRKFNTLEGMKTPLTLIEAFQQLQRPLKNSKLIDQTLPKTCTDPKLIRHKDRATQSQLQ